MFKWFPKNVVFCFQKSADEEIQFALSEKRGEPYVDIRVYYIQNETSKIATHKGIFVPVAKLGEIKEGIERLIDASKRESA